MELSPIKINQQEFGPFEADRINNAVRQDGLLYGAGYGLHMKPVFFISELDGQEVIEGHDIYIAGEEYARDLSIHPAMLQGKTVLARKDSATVLIWEKFEEFSGGKASRTLSAAFSHYGINAGEAPERIEKVVESELQSYIHHELGEAIEGEKLGSIWLRMLSSITSRKAELFARSIKDTLSDASEKGMLRHIIDRRNTGSLAFYLVFLGGYRTLLTKEVRTAFGEFMETGQWELIEDARQTCYGKAKKIADTLLDAYREDPKTLGAEIDRQITLSAPGDSL